MFTKEFLKATLERAIKTFAQTGVALIGVNAADVHAINWGDGLYASAVAALLSVLVSIGSGAVTDGGPSLTNAEVLDGGQ